ncbi:MULTISPECIES: hypothetical protein [unclassified Beijerinckia]|uniref:DUF6197 family protein n=1 Tax=unclassified Beijerinckia TaxID=2638183 RepID=UPI0008961E13|nr:MULTISPECIES: hypothetical protein [unclassified Beijerinckia]MDH7796401.1 hypothetical protein [Beijerinckia sp. GAS462]SEC43549.1 hypothetical protein SAMN05443249_2683 [Beijerinckia sp. 28-YEA-48]
MSNQLLENLKAVRNHLATPDRWTQHSLARNADGMSGLLPESGAAVCWCLFGALRAVELPHWSRAAVVSTLAKLIEPEAKDLHNNGVAADIVIAFNDADNRKHGEVLALLDKAIANAS